MTAKLKWSINWMNLCSSSHQDHAIAEQYAQHKHYLILTDMNQLKWKKTHTQQKKCVQRNNRQYSIYQFMLSEFMCFSCGSSLSTERKRIEGKARQNIRNKHTAKWCTINAGIKVTMKYNYIHIAWSWLWFLHSS